MIKVYAFTCGQVGVDPCVPDRSLSRSPVAYTGLFRSPKRRIWLPVKAFLIVHPKGNILVDTGWDKNVRERPIQTITFPMWFASKPRLPEGQSVDEQLARLGLGAEDLDAVLMTHMDIDHASGLRLVQSAKALYLSREEWAAIHSSQIRYTQRPWKGMDFRFITFESDAKAPYGKSWDIFGDGAVRIVFLPGHTQGSVAVKVSGKNGFVLIAGDTGYNAASWQRGKLPGPVYNSLLMRRSLEWVRAEAENEHCIAVLAAHDNGEQRGYFEL